MSEYHYLRAKLNIKDLPENYVDLYGKKFEIIGFSFGRNGDVELEFCRRLTKRGADLLKRGRVTRSRKLIKK